MTNKVSKSTGVRTVFAESLFDAEIPNGWRLLPIGEALAGSQYGLSLPCASSGSTPIVGMADISGGAVNLIDLPCIDVSRNDLAAMRLKPGDVLLNRTNSPDLVGKVGIVRKDSGAVFASYLVRLIVDREIADPEFVNYWLNTSSAQHALKRLSTRGVNQANINPTEFRKHFPLPLAPLSEQRRIAELLRTWDTALEKLAALEVAKLRQYGALARRFFDPCHPSVHKRPVSWREFALGEIFRERAQSGDPGDPLLSITMSDGVIDRNVVGRKDTSNQDKSRYKLILPGDLGYNTMRMWQGVSGLSPLRGIVSPAYTVIIPDNQQIVARYAAHLFKSRRMAFDFQRYSQGLTSDTWNLKFPSFSRIRVVLPPINQQKRQADLLDEVKAETAAVKLERDTLDRQRHGLMGKLLTGEWRVSGMDR